MLKFKEQSAEFRVAEGVISHQIAPLCDAIDAVDVHTCINCCCEFGFGLGKVHDLWWIDLIVSVEMRDFGVLVVELSLSLS